MQSFPRIHGVLIELRHFHCWKDTPRANALCNKRKSKRTPRLQLAADKPVANTFRICVYSESVRIGSNLWGQVRNTDRLPATHVCNKRQAIGMHHRAVCTPGRRASARRYWTLEPQWPASRDAQSCTRSRDVWMPWRDQMSPWCRHNPRQIWLSWCPVRRSSRRPPRKEHTQRSIRNDWNLKYCKGVGVGSGLSHLATPSGCHFSFNSRGPRSVYVIFIE